MANLRKLTPIKLADAIESLAEHALGGGLEPGEVIDQFKKRYLEIALDMNGGNQKQTARILGLNRNTVRNLMNRLRIERKGYTVKYGADGKYE